MIGEIFKEMIDKKYSYWGYCDSDVIFGDFERFVEKSMKHNQSTNIL